jgi:hypothetical protein
LLSLISGGVPDESDRKKINDLKSKRDQIKKDDEDVASGKKKVEEEDLNLNPKEIREDLSLFVNGKVLN